MSWLLCIVLAYLLGSIPYGLLIGLSKGVDIRDKGSGNIGATNVGRLLGRRFGIICFALDASKGATAVIFAALVNGVWGRPLGGSAAGDTLTALDVWLWLAVAVAALVGHMHSPWLKFKGGKGVATGFGGMLAMWPLLTAPALVALLVWILALRLTRYMSIASMSAALSLPASCLLLSVLPAIQKQGGLGGQLITALPLVITTGALATLVVYKHRMNIARLRAGTEPKIDI